jgi:hypothetical protein
MRTGFLLPRQTFSAILQQDWDAGGRTQADTRTSHFKVKVDVFVNAFLTLSLSARVLAAFKIGSSSGVDPLTGIIV